MSGRVLHVIDSLTAGGAERVLVELVNALSEQAVPVGVCVSRSGTQLASQLSPGVPLLVLNRRRTWDMPAIHRMVRYCRDQQVRVLHAHGRSTVQLCAVIKLLCGNRVRLLFHDHHGDVAVDQSVPRALRLISHGWVDHYVAVDPALQEWAARKLGLATDRTCVLGNAIDLQRFAGDGAAEAAVLPAVRQPVSAVILANLRPQKEHSLLWQALVRAHHARERLHVFVVGHDFEDGYSRQCHELVETFGLEENVTFLGSRTDIPQILAAVDLGLLSSRSESGPVTILEYMAAGLPFLATSTGQIALRAQQDGLGRFVGPGDVDGYAEALEELVSMGPEKRRQLGLRNRQAVADLFDVRQQARTLIGIYGNLENAPRRRGHGGKHRAAGNPLG
jgi:glycosyltransferase involved in cell wall biosynthesis